MSDLRKHLEWARRQYYLERYPGDLGVDMRQGTIGGKRWWPGVTVLAAAAALALGFWLRQSERSTEWALNSQSDVANVEDDAYPQEIGLADLSVVQWPEISEEIDFAPRAPDFSFPAPSFSLIQQDTSEQSPTTQEAIL